MKRIADHCGRDDLYKALRCGERRLDPSSKQLFIVFADTGALIELDGSGLAKSYGEPALS